MKSTIALILCMAVAILLANAVEGLGGCAGTRKPVIDPKDQVTADSVGGAGNVAVAVANSVTAVAQDTAGHARNAAVAADGAGTNVTAALAVPGLPAAAKPPLSAAAKGTATAAKEALEAEKGAKQIQEQVKELAAVKDQLATAQAQVEAMGREKAEAKAAAEKAQADVKAEREGVAAGLRKFALTLAGITVALVAAIFLLPYKPSAWIPAVTGAGAVVCFALAASYLRFIEWSQDHFLLIWGSVIAVVVGALAALAQSLGWFKHAVAYAETLKVSGDAAAVGADFKAKTGPLFAAAKHLAEKDWVKVKAWAARTAVRNAKTTERLHLAAVAETAKHAAANPTTATVTTP